jgi:hypothetical protein
MHQDALASEFRSPDTGEAPSSIDTSGLTRLEVVTPVCDGPGIVGDVNNIATSTAINDDLDVEIPIAMTTNMAGRDWSSAVAGGNNNRASTISLLEELILTSLQRSTESDGFGFSLSNGVYESGIYVGAVKHDGPAAEKLQPFDRILKVNGVKVIDLTCADVVPLIAQSGRQLDLVVSRRPLTPSASQDFAVDPAATTRLQRNSSPGYLIPTGKNPSVDVGNIVSTVGNSNGMCRNKSTGHSSQSPARSSVESSPLRSNTDCKLQQSGEQKAIVCIADMKEDSI